MLREFPPTTDVLSGFETGIFPPFIERNLFWQFFTWCTAWLHGKLFWHLSIFDMAQPVITPALFWVSSRAGCSRGFLMYSTVFAPCIHVTLISQKNNSEDRHPCTCSAVMLVLICYSFRISLSNPVYGCLMADGGLSDPTCLCYCSK